MQYSPRTESIVAVGAYADSIRWVSREREVPVFDRLAIMRHWYDHGQFDLYKATKDLQMAKNVHDCLGRASAATVIDAARLEAREADRDSNETPYIFRLGSALVFAAVAYRRRRQARAESTAAPALACNAPTDLTRLQNPLKRVAQRSPPASR